MQSILPRAFCLIVFSFLLAGSSFGTARAQAGGAPYVQWSCEKLQGMGYLVVEGREWSWIEGRGSGVTGARGTVELKRTPRPGERVIVRGPAGQAPARVLEQPRRENGFQTVVELPRPSLTWNNGDHWDCDERAEGPYELNLLLVPRREWEELQLIPGAWLKDQKKGFRFEAGGKWLEALDHWQSLVLRTHEPAVRQMALDRYAACHGRIEWKPTEADRHKADSHDCAATALYFSNTSTGSTVTNCEFKDNGGYAMTGVALADVAGYTANTASGNSTNVIHVTNMSLATDLTIDPANFFNGALSVSPSITIPAGVSLTLNAGVVIKPTSVGFTMFVRGPSSAMAHPPTRLSSQAITTIQLAATATMMGLQAAHRVTGGDSLCTARPLGPSWTT